MVLPTIDYQQATFFVALAAFLLSLACSMITGVLYFNSRGRVTQATIDRLESLSLKLNNDNSHKIGLLESEMRHVLTQSNLADALNPLYNLIRNQEAMNSKLSAEMHGVREQLSTLTNFLIKRGLE